MAGGFEAGKFALCAGHAASSTGGLPCANRSAIVVNTVDSSEELDSIRHAAAARFGVPLADIRVVVAPYRICPLGAHIDHQLGPVTAMAINRAVHLAFAPSRSREVKMASLSMPGEVRFSLDDVPEKQAGDWGNYLRGAVRALAAKHELREGMVGLTSGEYSQWGVSSSAAMGVASLMALEEVNGLAVSADENILLDQAIENGYLGLRNGILDQAAILLSRRGQLTQIDCATREHKRIVAGQTMPQWAVLLAYSGLSKSLVTTDYNKRVEECAEAARTLLEAVGRPDQAAVLGNVRPEEYFLHKRRLSGAPAKRAEHFFSEVARVEQGITAWQCGDLAGFGRAMNASGESSIHNYECGAPPLVTLYELLVATRGVYGARFSGAGFRGCCVALVDPAAAADIGRHVEQAYKARHPDLADRARTVICQTDDGARVA